MSKEYKVWLHVEVNNGPNADEEYEDTRLPDELLCTKSQKEAEDFADAIVEHAAMQLADCDPMLTPKPHKLKRKD